MNPEARATLIRESIASSGWIRIALRPMNPPRVLYTSIA